MLLFPRKTKYKKYQKGKARFKNIENKYTLPKFGFYGLKILGTKRIKSQQIEAARKIIRKRIKKKYSQSLKINLFSDISSTKKSSGVRMGKGKGNIDFWFTCGYKGKVIFEVTKSVPKSIVKRAFVSAKHKFPVKCRFIESYKNI